MYMSSNRCRFRSPANPRFKGQSCLGENQEAGPPNGSKIGISMETPPNVLQRGGSSAMSARWGGDREYDEGWAISLYNHMNRKLQNYI